MNEFMHIYKTKALGDQLLSFYAIHWMANKSICIDANSRFLHFPQQTQRKKINEENGQMEKIPDKQFRHRELERNYLYCSRCARNKNLERVLEVWRMNAHKDKGEPTRGKKPRQFMVWCGGVIFFTTKWIIYLRYLCGYLGFLAANDVYLT